MRTLLRNSGNGLYLQSPGAWTSQAEVALAFETMAHAIGFARQSELANMELVFVSDAAGPLLRVPLESIRYSCQRSGPSVPGPLNSPSLVGPL